MDVEEFKKKYPDMLKVLAGATKYYDILRTRRLNPEEKIEFRWLRHLILIYEDRILWQGDGHRNGKRLFDTDKGNSSRKENDKK